MSDTEFKLGAEDVPALGKALISLAREVWVLNDRLMVLEDLLTESKILAPDALDTHQPSQERQTEIDRKSREFLERIVHASGLRD